MSSHNHASSFIAHRSSLLLLVLLAVAVFLGIAFGATTTTDRTILFDIRLPRVVLAVFVGATLAVAGATFQTLLRNPLADPFILGVSGGAAAGAAVATAIGLGRIPGLVPFIAFAGACAATAVVFLLARRRDHTDPTRLLLSGLVLNAFFSAVILIAFSMTRGSDLTAALRWMMGSLAAATWLDVIILAVLFFIGFATLAFFASDIRMLTFGEDDARSRGVDVERVKLIGFAASSIITGAAVASTGIIGFVGLVVPHLVRLIWRRDFRHILPLAALLGAALVVLADLVARVAIRPAELPLAALTAILGVPFFLSLLRRAR